LAGPPSSPNAFCHGLGLRDLLVAVRARVSGAGDQRSCYGRRDFTTPNIDRIAARGMRFLQGYANSAVCSASRLALITGRCQYRLRLGLEEPLSGNPEVGLPPEHPTLPSLLKRAGYGTSLIGKWHLGALPKFGPLKSGYDHLFGLRGGGADYFSHINLLQRHDLWDQDVEVHQVGYLTDQLGAHAVDAVNSYAKSVQPFLISLHFNAPHFPWEGPGDEAESKRLAGTALRDFDGGTQKTYQRMIEAMDAQIGRVLEALDPNGLTENTIVIFTSDNGGERFADTWPFAGKKTDSCSTWSRIRSSAPILRSGTRTSTSGLSPSGRRGTRRCCRKSPRALAARSPARSSPTTTACSKQARRPI
jgi:arylsulfatase A-like enzyme